MKAYHFGIKISFFIYLYLLLKRVYADFLFRSTFSSYFVSHFDVVKHGKNVVFDAQRFIWYWISHHFLSVFEFALIFVVGCYLTPTHIRSHILLFSTFFFVCSDSRFSDSSYSIISFFTWIFIRPISNILYPAVTSFFSFLYPNE